MSAPLLESTKMLALSQPYFTQAMDFIEFMNRVKGKDLKTYALQDEDTRALTELVCVAGFGVRTVSSGDLLGDVCEQGGTTGEKFSVNYTFPFKLLDERGEVDVSATGWIAHAFRRVGSQLCHASFRPPVDPWDVAVFLAKEVERSIPLKPIMITAAGDFLCEHRPGPWGYDALDYFVEHTRDSHVLAGRHSLGFHMNCGGHISLRGATENSNALVCQCCGRLALFDRSVKIYGELRQWLLRVFSGGAEEFIRD